MIFASLARAHERVHVQNVRDFPQTKLDSEINSPFLFKVPMKLKIFCAYLKGLSKYRRMAFFFLKYLFSF